MKGVNRLKLNTVSCTLLVGVLVFAIMLNFTLVFAESNDRNKWLIFGIDERTHISPKPVDPVYINYPNDVISLEYDVEGENYWNFKYDLKAGKKYHIFLVGEWISNETDPITDYDIEIIKPNGIVDNRFTESAGLVEFVHNDDYYQYYIPTQSGEYTFKIINDERDSTGNQPAIFMIIEHIDINKEYSQYLEGRRYIPETDSWNETTYSGWGYEFNTSSPIIRVKVDVPNRLDMYEARLYVMAIPDLEVGYTINDVGIPLGDYFDTFKGEYGGYSALTEGDRNILAMDSAESEGVPLNLFYEKPASFGNESNVFYYLAIIAEHNSGTVDFVVQTDFDSPVISLYPLEVGIEGEPIEISVTIEDDTEIGDVWIEYTTDEGETLRNKDLSKKGDGYVCELSSLLAGKNVEFTIYAKDYFGNKGSIKSEFQVKKKISLDCYVNKKNLYADESAIITGSSNLNSANLDLTFTNGETVKSIQAKTDENGALSFTFTPQLLGEWSFLAEFVGSETEIPVSSHIINFTVMSRETHISGYLSESQVKKNEQLVVSGSVIPKTTGMAVDILFVSASTSHSESVSTSSDGSFAYTYEPSEVGTWNVLAKVGDGFVYDISQSEIMDLEVLPLTIIDKVYLTAQKMIVPPFLYGTIGLFGIVISSIFYIKRDVVISALPSGLTKRFGGNGGKKKDKRGKNSKRYRRKKK